jgi:hypothetical protein
MLGRVATSDMGCDADEQRGNRIWCGQGREAGGQSKLVLSVNLARPA